ncbi:2-phosphoxylose phosphatase 1-like [Ptychodera flava]|uniref:2-phosphoxylose phosphatase 1-like n=1 Tax=Ptychodera flava TaxID=63121 RepID=UPI00396A9D39
MNQSKMNRLWRRYALGLLSFIVILLVLQSIWIFGSRSKEKTRQDFNRKSSRIHDWSTFHVNTDKKIDGEGNERPNVSTASGVYNRIMKYCNLPSVIGQGMEGEPVSDHRLRHVAVVTRHGDRTSMTSLPSMKSPWSCSFNEKMRELYPAVLDYVNYMRENANRLRAPDRLRQLKYLPDKKFCASRNSHPREHCSI